MGKITKNLKLLVEINFCQFHSNITLCLAKGKNIKVLWLPTKVDFYLYFAPMIYELDKTESLIKKQRRLCGENRAALISALIFQHFGEFFEGISTQFSTVILSNPRFLQLKQSFR